MSSRNTQVLSAMGLLLCCGAAMAQNNNPLTPPIPVVASPVSTVAAPYPVTKSVQPTWDVPGNTFFPSMSQNIAALVGYDQLFWQMQQNGVNGVTVPYSGPITMSANINLVPTMATTQLLASVESAINLQSIMAWNLDASLAVSTYSSVPGTDIQPPSEGSVSDTSFNADAILGAINHPNDKNSLASVNNLVAFLSGSANPIGGLTLSKDKKTRQNQLQGQSVQSYLLEARTAAAAQSVAFSNLNYLAQERVTMTGLGTSAGLTTLPTDGKETKIPDASQLQLEQFLVDRRVGNANWYASMNSASSIALQRETLFVLAEISKQLYQQKILTERLLAGQVAMQQQTAQINRTKIAYDQQSVQQSLSSGG